MGWHSWSVEGDGSQARAVATEEALAQGQSHGLLWLKCDPVTSAMASFLMGHFLPSPSCGLFLKHTSCSVAALMKTPCPLVALEMMPCPQHGAVVVGLPLLPPSHPPTHPALQPHRPPLLRVALPFSVLSVALLTSSAARPP